MQNERIEREIVDLHRFFEGWFTGRLPATDEAFVDVEGRLGEGFVLISPRGDVDERGPLLEGLRRAHGGRPEGFRIGIDNVELRHSRDGIHVATYEEWQQEGEKPANRRLSSVVFVEDEAAPNGLTWLHVHEVWLNERRGA